MLTLNLLPPIELQRLHRLAEIRRWRRAFIGLAIGVLGGNFIAGGAQWWVQQRADDLGASLRQTRTEQNSTVINDYTEKIRGLNSTVKPLQNISSTPRSWSADLAGFINSLPPNIELTEISLTIGSKVTLSGLSRTRSDFIQLDAQLKDHPWLQNVTTSSRPDKRENLPFTYQATLIKPSS